MTRRALPTAMVLAWSTTALGSAPSPVGSGVPDQRPIETTVVAERWEIKTPGRRFTPAPGIEPQLRARLQRGPAAAPAWIQLTRAPSPEDRSALRAAGVELGPLFSGTTYGAEVAAHSRLESGPLVRWAGLVRPEDRVEPALWAGRVEDWARAGADRIKVLVEFRVAAEAPGVFARIGSPGAPHGPNPVWAAQVTLRQLRALAAEEAVKWVEPGPKPMMPLGE